MTVSAEIEIKLREAFAPVTLNVIDESEQHRGHGGWREGGETHFRVEMTSAKMNGMTRVAQQRAVYSALKEELAGPVHALALDIKGTEK